MINQVTLVGRLTKDPELRRTPEGTSVSQVTLAVSRHFRNQNGELEADFVHCTLWRKAAENTCLYCRKGSVVGITGRLQTRNYENKDGKRVYVTEVVAETVRFLSGKPAGLSSTEATKPAGAGAAASSGSTGPTVSTGTASATGSTASTGSRGSTGSMVSAASSGSSSSAWSGAGTTATMEHDLPREPAPTREAVLIPEPVELPF